MKLSELPPVSASLKAGYVKIIEDVERIITGLGERLQEYIRCAPACSSCCRDFSVFPLEAVLISEQFKASPPPDGHERHAHTCTFLHNDLCSIYAHRPLICRTQGMAIGYIDEINERIEVSVCPLNFHDDYAFTPDDLLFLDTFNSRLADLNVQYCQEADISIDTRIVLE